MKKKLALYKLQLRRNGKFNRNSLGCQPAIIETGDYKRTLY